MRDVNFKDGDLPDLTITDYTKETRYWNGEPFTVLVPKDRVNNEVITTYGETVEDAKADINQGKRDLSPAMPSDPDIAYLVDQVVAPMFRQRLATRMDGRAATQKVCVKA